jgi:hypothetical protein
VLSFEILLLLTAVSGLSAAACWVRVASSGALKAAAKLDGTEKQADKANRRALSAALIASSITVGVAAAALWIGFRSGVL